MPLREGAWRMPPAQQSYKLPWLWKLSSRCCIVTVGVMSKLWLQWLNTAKIHNKDVFHELVEKRSKGRGLITVCNHTSCIDDPMLWGMLKLKHMLNFDKMRYGSAAEDICFKTDLWSVFFSLGKVYPVTRGDGVYQKGMDWSVDQLDMGNWCHFFPEGKVNATKEFLRLKWGVGRLLAECQTTPLVLPIWHVGFDSILPNRTPYIPLIRKKVTVLVGKPLDFTSEVESLKALKKTPKEIRKHLTDLIQDEFKKLKETAEVLHNDWVTPPLPASSQDKTKKETLEILHNDLIMPPLRPSSQHETKS